MADFSFLSDTDESAVDDLLSQAMDHAVLDQVAAINCSGFTDSVLPTHLETRFRKLKSFPSTKPNKSPSLSTGKKKSESSSFNSRHHSVKSPKTQIENELKNNSVGPKTESDSLSDDENMFFSPSKEDPDPVQKKGLKPKFGSGSVSLSSKSSNSSTENTNFSHLKKNPDLKMGSKSKSRGGSLSSPSNSWNSSMESLSPPRKTGCFWCSPKKDSRKKNKGTHDWGDNDEFLTDLNTFSAKEQRKVLKKAMEEQKKISREAEKIVKWAKQASARMEVSGLEDDELSDNESIK